MALSLFYPEFERDLFWASPFLRGTNNEKSPFYRDSKFYSEDENGYTVEMNVCGKGPDEIDVNVKGKTLSVRTNDQTFSKTYTFPTEIEADKASCEYKYGKVTIHLPKRILSATSVNIPVTVATN